MDIRQADPDELIAAFGKAARRALLDHVDAAVPGVGVLRVKHEASRAEVMPDGRRKLHPPRDIVLLDPEAS